MKVENKVNSFSQRIGMKPIKSIVQIESIDEVLKNALWNGLTIFYWDGKIKYDRIKANDEDIVIFLSDLWINFFKERLDELPNNFLSFHKIIKRYFFNADWYEVFDLLEYIPNNFKHKYDKETNDRFKLYCNNILEREMSAYRFIEGLIVQISSKVEIASIEESLSITKKLKPVNIHLNRAIELLSDRKSPDYRNSIKESISAVEAYCSILTQNSKATLGQALKQIEKSNKIHSALKNSFNSLYGYTSDADGIRHSLMDEVYLNQEDAKFMLIACSAFINYLLIKDNSFNN